MKTKLSGLTVLLTVSVSAALVLGYSDIHSQSYFSNRLLRLAFQTLWQDLSIGFLLFVVVSPCIFFLNKFFGFLRPPKALFSILFVIAFASAEVCLIRFIIQHAAPEVMSTLSYLAVFILFASIIVFALSKEKLAHSSRSLDHGISLTLFALLLFSGIFYIIDLRFIRGTSHNIVWVVIDALRADHLGCYGYDKDTSPFIDSLAREGAFFKNAISQESYTEASVPSYFTSTYPLVHKTLYDQPEIDMLASKFVTVAEILKNENYQTIAFVYNPHLKKKFNFAQGFDIYDDDSDRINSAGGGTYNEHETIHRTFDKLNSFLKNSPQKKPLFLYLHYRDVHSPYVPPPPYHTMFLPKGIEGMVDILYKKPYQPKRENAEIYLSQYDGEIRYTDGYLQKTFDLLKNHKINRDNTIFIITADHGEEFFDEHPNDTGWIGHKRTLYQELVHVPLILLIPEFKNPRVIENYVELNDLLPTILDALGTKGPFARQFQGLSLIPLTRGNTQEGRVVFSGGNHGRGMFIHKSIKYYHYDKGSKDMEGLVPIKPLKDYPYDYRDELYDLSADSREKNNLAGVQPQKIRDFENRLLQMIENNSQNEEPGTVIPDDKTIEQLKSLGYL